MKNIRKISLIIFALCCNLIFFLGLYLGAFKKPKIVLKSVPAMKALYRHYKGPYQKLPSQWDQFLVDLKKIGVDKCTPNFGVYLNSPDKVKAEELRSVLGCALSASDLARIEQMTKESQAQLAQFSQAELPSLQLLGADFPLKSELSYFLGPKIVYPYINDQILLKKDIPSFALELYFPDQKYFTLTLGQETQHPLKWMESIFPY